MGFKIPKQLEDYLSKDWRKPPENFVNCSQYYAGLDPYFINYMNAVVRPCVAYSSGCADGYVNSGIKLNIGYTLKKTAVRLLQSDKVLYQGNDKDCKFLSDYWAKSVKFESFMEGAIDYMLDGATLIKINKDVKGRVIPTAVRVDRYYATTDDEENVLRVNIFNSFISSEKNAGLSYSYWLSEERYYKNGKPYIRYKVNLKSGVAGKEVLPTIGGDGIPQKDLPETVKQVIKARGIVLNKEMRLPFRDGLGCWILKRTKNNSCVPGIALGDPLLYGALDILWAIDTLFSGTVTDVLLGQGKILVPKKYLQTIRDDFLSAGYSEKSALKMARSDVFNDSDDSLVYIYTEHDKDFTPQKVQFDIRSEQYRGMLDVYLRQLVSHCGFAPTTVFPFLEDRSAKTATEVTAEDNLTRATVLSMHKAMTEIFDRVINEVLYQLYKDCGQEYKGQVSIKLSDYIGNPLQRDQNLRENYNAGLTPKEVAVQRINDLSDTETNEYLSKIAEDEKSKNVVGFDFPYGGS